MPVSWAATRPTINNVRRVNGGRREKAILQLARDGENGRGCLIVMGEIEVVLFIELEACMFGDMKSLQVKL